VKRKKAVKTKRRFSPGEGFGLAGSRGVGITKEVSTSLEKGKLPTLPSGKKSTRGRRKKGAGPARRAVPENAIRIDIRFEALKLGFEDALGNHEKMLEGKVLGGQ